MKSILTLSFLVIAQWGVAQVLPGAIGHWKMDSECALTDESVQFPAHGVLIDVSRTTDKDNVAQAALLFNSSTSYVTMGAAAKLKLANDKSICFRVRPVLTGSNHTGSVFLYGTGIIIRYEELSGVARLNVMFGNVSYMVVNLVANQWQAVTIAFKKDFSSTTSKAYCYLNGVQVSEAEKNKTAHDFSNAIAMIGPPNQNTLTNGFRGSLDDLVIYDRTLTSAEILNQALPVTIEFFRARRVNGLVELNWKTQLEDNVSRFDMQKSIDGIIFQTISQVNAGKYNYLAYDLSGTPSRYSWYRLRITDRDGKSAYSNVIRVSSEGTNEDVDGAIRLFPNPASRYINITGASGAVKISIINNSGTIVKQLQFPANNAVDISDLVPGIYYIILFDGNRKTTSKFNKR